MCEICGGKIEKLKGKMRRNSFPSKTLIYLYEVGQPVKCADIRYSIGLDDYTADSMYEDRSSYQFANTIANRLLRRGLIRRVKEGWYKITVRGIKVAKELKNEKDN